MELFIHDTEGRPYGYEWSQKGGNLRVTVPSENCSLKNTKLVFKFPELEKKTGEKGFYLIPDTPQKGSFVIQFKKVEDCNYEIRKVRMPMFAVSGERSYLVIADGMQWHMQILTGVKEDQYYICPQFDMDGYGIYEDLSMDIIELSPYASVAEIAKAYRAYQLKKGCVPLSQRIKNNGVLQYMSESIEVRIRMGWKPVPSPIEHQTEENEPDMYVACDFERVMDLMDEMKVQGIEKAHITLVGWNKSGHDGRWPQIFPVDERLGGEAKLKKLIEHAGANGYLISCHTNSTDAYTIADNWNRDSIRKKESGELDTGYVWGGGRAYILCPECARKIAEEELPKVKNTGFTGGLYIDVLTAVAPTACFHEEHPLTRADTVAEYKKIMKLAKGLFGAFQSEGGYLYAPELLDYAFYTVPKEDIWDCGDAFFDYEVPLWQLVYNGIILSNAYTSTTNCTTKDKKTVLRAIEYGTRQTFYIYSKFMTGSGADDWLGSEDLKIGTDDELKYAVHKMKEGYDIFRKMSDLTTCFMEDYTIQGNIHTVYYSNGKRVIVDYDTQSFRIE